MSAGGPPAKQPSLSATRVESIEAPPVSERGGAKAKAGVFLVTAGRDTGRVIPVPLGEVVTFGRDESCSARFDDDDSLSRVHSRCVRIADAYVLSDAKSTNGTYVNGARIATPTTLQDGDAVGLGRSTRLRFALLDDLEREALVAMYEARSRATELAPDHEEDLQQAHEFQLRLLAEVPPVAGVRIDTLYRPLEMVGGDLYRMHVQDDGALRVLVADAVGHGVRASLSTMLVVSAYESVRALATPAETLRALNDAIATKYAHARVQLTAALLDFDFARATVRLATAAHPSPLLLRAGEITEIAGAGGPILGLVPGVDFADEAVALARGDRVVVFTDGCTDVFAPDGAMLGDAGPHAAVRSAGEGDVAAAVGAALTAFARGKSLADDVTLVSVAWP